MSDRSWAEEKAREFCDGCPADAHWIDCAYPAAAAALAAAIDEAARRCEEEAAEMLEMAAKQNRQFRATKEMLRSRADTADRCARAIRAMANGAGPITGLPTTKEGT